MSGSHEGDLYMRYIQDNMTIGEITEFTPKTEDVIEKISFRLKDSLLRQLVNKSEINMQFEVQKFIYLEYVCYEIYQKNLSETAKEHLTVSASPVFDGVILDVQFTDSLKRSQYLKVTLHDIGRDPFRALQLTPQFRRDYNESTGRVEYSTLNVHQTVFSATLLPPPFASNCLDYPKIGFVDDDHCTIECYKLKVLKAFDRLPFDYISHDQDPDVRDKMMISYPDIMIEETAEALQKLRETCDRHEGAPCMRATCYSDVTVTFIEGFPSERFTVRQTLPEEPYVSSKMLPVMTVIDYFNYGASILATYTGFCVWMFNFKNLRELFTLLQLKLRGQSDEKIVKRVVSVGKTFPPHLVTKVSALQNSLDMLVSDICTLQFRNKLLPHSQERKVIPDTCDMLFG
jgi:hypothetical protein